MKNILLVSVLVGIVSSGAFGDGYDENQGIQNKSIYTDIYQQAGCNAIYILSFGKYHCI